MSYEKPWTSYPDQLNLLRRRGLKIADEARALHYLQHLGYYRLSGYWYAFRQRDGNDVHDAFKPGSTFDNIVELYAFDRELRMLVLEAVERIEVSLRVAVSHTLGELDPFAHTKPACLDRSFTRARRPRHPTRHARWMERHKELVQRSRERFVTHHRDKYGLPLAIWVECELWDFGALSVLYSGMRKQERDIIAQQFQVPGGRMFDTWLRSLRYLRNVCAHYSRLWNRNITDRPSLSPAGKLAWLQAFENDRHARTRCFVLLCLCRHLMSTVNPTSSWPQRLQEHLEAFPGLDHVGLDLSAMGARKNWRSIWQQADTKNPSAI